MDSAAADFDPETEARETGPQRRCIVTRERGDKSRMIRFVVGPDRGLVPDLLAHLPGRGMWLSARRDVLDSALAKGGFARVARGAVVVPGDLAGRLIEGLERRIVECLGLARRAGQAVAGFEKAREWTLSGRAGLVVEAADGSPSERARLVSGYAGPVIAPISADRLGGPFGRERAVHVAVAEGRLAELLWIEAERLAGIAGHPEMMDYREGKRANI